MTGKNILLWRLVLVLFMLLILFINPNLNNAYTEDQPKITAMAAGMKYSLALSNDGTVWAWGNNDFGQLGDGTNINRNTPVKVKNITNVIGIAGGESYSIALKKDGTVWEWEEKEGLPSKIKNIENVVSIGKGYDHSLAAKKDGSVWSWGINDKGQLGNGLKNINYNHVVRVKDLMNIVKVSCGEYCDY